MTVLAGLLAFGSLFLYAYAIRHKGKEPVKASWIIWTIVDISFLFSMYEKHALNGQIVGSTVGVCIILILALRYGSMKMYSLPMLACAIFFGVLYCP